MLKIGYLILTLTTINLVYAQQAFVGKIIHKNKPVAFINIYNAEKNEGATTNEKGIFKLPICKDSIQLLISGVGFVTKISTFACATDMVIIQLEKSNSELEEMVVSGTFGEVIKRQSPMAVESYSSAYLQKAPSFGVLEATQNINGVRPQLNCAVCNTGDIHINGKVDAYKITIIDGNAYF